MTPTERLIIEALILLLKEDWHRGELIQRLEAAIEEEGVKGNG